MNRGLVQILLHYVGQVCDAANVICNQLEQGQAVRTDSFSVDHDNQTGEEIVNGLAEGGN